MKTVMIALLCLVLQGCLEGGSDSSSVSDGGSISSFAIQNGYLYALSENRLTAYTLVLPNYPQLVGGPYGQYSIQQPETLFSYKNDLLLVGTQLGVEVFNVEDNGELVYLDQFSHTRGCDPVVAHNDVAYSTVRSGNGCGMALNSLYVLDLSEPSNVKLMDTLSAPSPRGLAVFNQKLLVCNGDQFPITSYDIISGGLLKQSDEIFENCEDILVLNDDTIALTGNQNTSIVKVKVNESDDSVPPISTVNTIEIGSFQPNENSLQREFYSTIFVGEFQNVLVKTSTAGVEL